jgi:hypothetical protein
MSTEISNKEHFIIGEDYTKFPIPGYYGRGTIGGDVGIVLGSHRATTFGSRFAADTFMRSEDFATFLRENQREFADFRIYTVTIQVKAY